MDSWWHTPIHSDFLESVRSSFMSGNIAIVILPMHTPDGFLTNLRDKCNTSGQYYFDRIDLNLCSADEPNSIGEFLYSHFEIERVSEKFVKKTAASLFDNESVISDRIFVFENLPNDLSKQFRDFIIDLGRFLVSKQNYDRHKILVVLDAHILKHDLSLIEQGIQQLKFEGIWDDLDGALGLRYFLQNSFERLSELEERVITSLSVFDTNLMQCFVESDHLLSSYQNILVDFAIERNWKEVKYISPESLTWDEINKRWSKGILEKYGENTIYHSAYLKIHNKDDEINRRVWKAGMQVLLPLIEEFRDIFVRSKKVIFPFKFINSRTEEIITDMSELEIGDICYLKNRNEIRLKHLAKQDKRKVKEFINLCRNIRNTLSHLKMAEVRDIDQFFEDYDEIEELLISD